jgi:hypothetical protein
MAMRISACWRRYALLTIAEILFERGAIPGKRHIAVFVPDPDIILGDHEEEDWTAGPPQGPKQTPPR